MPPGDDNDEDDGRVLAPEELDISDDEHVAEIEDGRYVVSPNDPIGDVDGIETSETTTESSPSQPAGDTDEEPEQQSPPPSHEASDTSQSSGEPWQDDATATGELTEADVEAWLRDSFNTADSRYGFHVTATFDGRVSQRRMMSNDVVTIFESLILWYAQHIDSETPVEEILGILLTESNVPISYPTESLSAAIKARGLGPDDTIGELMEAIGEDGFEL
ncbi:MULTISPECIES: hypothetical protein [unclassified Halorhabdus]|uniref:DUF7500 family protein n=1 Tax=unclassified Halorhabdus TaxID=2621901 RepID=UPI0023DC9686|nr:MULTISPECIES: hypothetical protein [unclassified Halorhabdus]WEL16856.1 Uncharacterized protein SVXHr_0677 [Halorhabdus sp. SVX81]WEL20730.1 Uncharacterized protein HBNXHr_0657 [Halorhabdus sp. BNX81]